MQTDRVNNNSKYIEIRIVNLQHRNELSIGKRVKYILHKSQRSINESFCKCKVMPDRK